MFQEEHSHTDMLTSSTRTRMDITTQLTISSKTKKQRLEDLLLPTLTCLSLLLWATNLAMLKPIQIHLLCGKHNSVTSPTELKLLLINSCAQEKLSGMSRMDLLCCFLTDTMATAQSIHHAELKDTCSSVTKTNSFQRTYNLSTLKD